jgi:hypothetical protein
MPTTAFGPAINNSKRIAAWQAHYQRKGCSERKANNLAVAKCRSRQAWPPASS